MKPLLYFFAISILIFISCNTPERDLSMVGKWYHISKNGYSELEIDSFYVVAFSEKLGKSKLEYTIEKDSFKYLTINYSAKIIPKGDSMRILRNNYNSVETLKKYDESLFPFEIAPDESDSLRFEEYVRNFSQRAFQALVREGYIRPE
jgi:uncharacterized protein YlbG (UPF0298 family)